MRINLDPSSVLNTVHCGHYPLSVGVRILWLFTVLHLVLFAMLNFLIRSMNYLYKQKNSVKFLQLN